MRLSRSQILGALIVLAAILLIALVRASLAFAG